MFVSFLRVFFLHPYFLRFCIFYQHTSTSLPLSPHSSHFLMSIDLSSSTTFPSVFLLPLPLFLYKRNQLQNTMNGNQPGIVNYRNTMNILCACQHPSLTRACVSLVSLPKKHRHHQWLKDHSQPYPYWYQSDVINCGNNRNILSG
jgi:hypothetical protein